MEWLLLLLAVAVVVVVVALAIGRRRRTGLPEGVTDPAVRQRLGANTSSGYGGWGGNQWSLRQASPEASPGGRWPKKGAPDGVGSVRAGSGRCRDCRVLRDLDGAPPRRPTARRGHESFHQRRPRGGPVRR